MTRKLRSGRESQKILKSLVVVTLVYCATFATAMACTAPPTEFTKPKRLLVADSDQIAWARALEPSDIRALLGLSDEAPRFEVIEVLKGEVASPFTLSVGSYADLDTNPALIGDDFDGHRDGNLLALYNSRSFNNSRCEMAPVFVPGESYLIFLDHPHWAAYEIVRSEEDLWLQTVRKLIREQGE